MTARKSTAAAEEALCGATCVDPFRSSTPGVCDLPPGHGPMLEHHDGAFGCWHEEVAQWPPAGDAPEQLAPASARARAERILSLVAGHGEKIVASTTNPLDVPDYVLLTLVQAGDALVRLAELDGQRAPVVEVVFDGDGDLWVLVGENQFECQSGHDEHQTLEQIRDRFGVTRTFVAAPPADR